MDGGFEETVYADDEDAESQNDGEADDAKAGVTGRGGDFLVEAHGALFGGAGIAEIPGEIGGGRPGGEFDYSSLEGGHRDVGPVEDFEHPLVAGERQRHSSRERARRYHVAGP